MSRGGSEPESVAAVIIEVDFSKAGGTDLARHLRHRLELAAVGVVVDSLSESERECVRVTSTILEAEVVTETVTITYHGNYVSSFRCPVCGRKVSMKNSYPLSFSSRSCGGCDRAWKNTEPWTGDVGPRVEDLEPGPIGRVRVMSPGPWR